MIGKQPKQFDIVAVLQAPPSEQVLTGDVGTVVHLLPPDAVEVEFLDREGHTRCVVPIPVADLLVLNRDRTPVT